MSKNPVSGLKELLKKTLAASNLVARSVFSVRDVFQNNEVAANYMVSRMCVMVALLLALTKVLNVLGVFNFHSEYFDFLVLESTVELMIPVLLCRRYKGQKPWLKYLLLLMLTFAFARLDWMLGFNVVLVICIPVVVSCRYFSSKLTLFTGAVTAVMFLVSTVNRATGYQDMNFIFFPEGTTILVPPGGDIENAAEVAELGYYKVFDSLILHQYLPKMLPFFIILTACVFLTRQGQSLVLSQAQITGEHSRVETELELARNIQRGQLPIVPEGSSLRHHPEVEIFASMEPAKEVGGDFYDFFMVDPTHLAMVIADVSGKGVPAAMFMMLSKLLLSNSLSAGRSPAQVLREVNRQLCEKSMEDMFVTVWVGLLDLETGDLVSANAGHEDPLLCRREGGFERVRERHSLVLGGMQGVRYREQKLHLNPGDVLFLYTDGVPESNAPDGSFFGMERTIKALNRRKGQTLREMGEGLTADLRAFADTAPQFDDTTMLALRLRQLVKKEALSLIPTMESITTVADYVEGILEKAEVSMKQSRRMAVAVDEIYSNIVLYSGANWADVLCTVTQEDITVTFRDNGVPYNPTVREDPNITAAAEERDLGGLGIFMTRKLMSEVRYVWEDGCNCVTLKLNLN